MINFLSNMLLIEGLFFIVLFFYSLLKQGNKFALIMSLICFSISVYVIGYRFELSSNNVEQIKFFLKTEYFGVTFAIIFGMIFSYKFHFNKNPSLKLGIAFLIIPMLTLFLASTNEFHHLLYTNISTTFYNGFVIANIDRGPWYYINVIYSYIALSFGIVVFYSSWRFYNYKLRTQAFLLLCSMIGPALISIPHILKVSPLKIDITPLGLWILAISYLIAVFSCEFLQIKDIISNFTFSNISEGVMVVDNNNKLIDFNDAAMKIFNCLSIMRIGTDFTSFWDDKNVTCSNKDSFELQISNNELVKYYELRIITLRENIKTFGYIYFIQDITNQKKIMEKLYDMANYDDLTQVYNRRKLMEEAEKELFRARICCNEISVFIMDIDHFKKVNDKYGHLAGDAVIKSVVKACKDNLRITDIIGRYGGEEFIIILPGTNRKNGRDIAERVRTYIQESEIKYKNEKINVTVSIGIVCAIIKDDTISVEKIINEADRLLYCAKNHGRNQVCSCEL